MYLLPPHSMRDGIVQLVYSTVRRCGSDGVVAKDGGVVALNHSVVTRNRHNGVLAQVRAPLVRVIVSAMLMAGHDGNNGVLAQARAP